VKIYPNPTKGILNINTGGISNGYVLVTDVLGRTVIQTQFSADQFSLDLTGLQSRSTYFLSIHDDNGTVIDVQRIVRM